MWCWVALGLWAAERIHRFLRWLYINAIVTGPDQIKQPKPPSVTPPTTSQFQYPPSPSFLPLSREQAPLIPSSEYNPPPGYAHAELVSGATVRLTYISPKPISWAPGQHFLINVPSVSYFTTHPFTVASACDEQAPSRTLVFLVRCKAGWTRDLWHHIAELSYRTWAEYWTAMYDLTQIQEVCRMHQVKNYLWGLWLPRRAHCSACT